MTTVDPAAYSDEEAVTEAEPGTKRVTKLVRCRKAPDGIVMELSVTFRTFELDEKSETWVSTIAFAGRLLSSTNSIRSVP